MRKKPSQRGFSLVELLAIIIVACGVVGGGWLVYRHSKHSKPSKTDHAVINTPAPTNKTSAPPVQSDLYKGWKTATSSRAKFSIRYPASWTYTEVLGRNDNVEHITIDNANIHIAIDSYTGKDPANGGVAGTTCSDCSKTLHSIAFSIPNLGKASLDTVTYKLDAGTANAMILRLADETYYIPSGSVQGVSTSFRAISNLDSEAAYQQETTSQFMGNADYGTAQKILESVSY